jgi:hypothetical protein
MSSEEKVTFSILPPVPWPMLTVRCICSMGCCSVDILVSTLSTVL